jgi:hypothetical protein
LPCITTCALVALKFSSRSTAQMAPQELASNRMSLETAAGEQRRGRAESGSGCEHRRAPWLGHRQQPEVHATGRGEHAACQAVGGPHLRRTCPCCLRPPCPCRRGPW